MGNFHLCIGAVCIDNLRLASFSQSISQSGGLGVIIRQTEETRPNTNRNRNYSSLNQPTQQKALLPTRCEQRWGQNAVVVAVENTHNTLPSLCCDLNRGAGQSREKKGTWRQQQQQQHGRARCCCYRCVIISLLTSASSTTSHWRQTQPNKWGGVFGQRHQPMNQVAIESTNKQQSPNQPYCNTVLAGLEWAGR